MHPEYRALLNQICEIDPPDLFTVDCLIECLSIAAQAARNAGMVPDVDQVTT